MATIQVKDKITQKLMTGNDTIERHINNVEISGRDITSQDVLLSLRSFIQAIMVRLYAENHDITQDYGSTYDEMKKATSEIKYRVPFLGKFFDFVQTSASHYILDPNNAERVMLKYLEYLIRTKTLVQERFNIQILRNLDKFPVNTDKSLQDYYEKIAQKIDNKIEIQEVVSNERYYVQKVKPFFVQQRIYYEVTFVPISATTNKSDRIIAFTKHNISKYYAAKLKTVRSSVNVLDRNLPILIIKEWKVDIRPVEIENLGKIFGTKLRGSVTSAEGRGLMDYLTQTGTSLVDIIHQNDQSYNQIKQIIWNKYTAKTTNIFKVIDQARAIIMKQSDGANVVSYLLLHLNNEVSKKQMMSECNSYLSNLCLNYKCIPFDKMPFNSSLANHNPSISDVFECVDSNNRKDELLARYVRQNTEQNGVLYTNKKNLANFDDIDTLVETYNEKIYPKHRPDREIHEFNNHLYISEDQTKTLSIIEMLSEYSKEGLTGYSNAVDKWLLSTDLTIDDESKKIALKTMFENSKVAFIYGSAGTGKTTLINQISTFFRDSSRLYLAQTNPAVDNMKSRVLAHSDDTEFLTISKFLSQTNNKTDFDLLIIDECSTVSNYDMEKILRKIDSELILLVGDTFQIESIRFGDWFTIVKDFLSTSSNVVKLGNPYRSATKDLQTYWDAVRNCKDNIQELDARLQYSEKFNESIFQRSERDEIVLCLNYDGLYGINNINTLLQENNPNKKIQVGLKSYKIDDPILFIDTERFRGIFYNNLKGWIRGIARNDTYTQFDIEIDKPLTELDVRFSDLELLENDETTNPVVRFVVENPENVSESDDNEFYSIESVVPFQVAYAVSIHKSQGLEYDSVKIVITDEVGEKITHSIFYTAITRAKNSLKIYWSPEIEQKITQSLQPKSNSKDVVFLKQVLKNNVLHS
ncbi:ATP-dependent DNA helicase [Leuconostoc mesenteroides]|uniref:ATP-dependent DNA helicase n=1 Tax=Leuconostoc mesenteroides TaxID=1245 RepID=UPI0025A2863D|nr:AAA family ATPase [Leuconostoc mesenteroides]MDM7540010.1 AAA family ATPase [Leuconostoc mesenteroides]